MVMRVLEVVEASGAGVGRHVTNLCRGLAAEGYDITVAYSPYRLDEAFKRFIAEQRWRINFSLLEVPREISIGADLRAASQLVRLMKREGPFDVIHGHSSKGGALARIAGGLLNIPTVYTPNSLILSSPDLPKAKRVAYYLIERILGRFATCKMIAVSRNEREFILGLKLVPAKRIALVENSLEDEYFDLVPEKSDSCGSAIEKPLTFGAAMRFSPQKGPLHLVEAFIAMRETVPEIPAQLLIAGDGELFDQVKTRVEASEVSTDIHFLGWIEDVKSLLRKLDIFVLPSLYEGLSYAILEAMAARLPIVSTECFGAQETIGRVPGNILVPTGDPEALAQGMRQMATLTDPRSVRTSLRAIGQANYDHVRANFRQSRLLERTVEVYQSCVSTARK